jgi:hypothetical protein
MAGRVELVGEEPVAGLGIIGVHAVDIALEALGRLRA